MAMSAGGPTPEHRAFVEAGIGILMSIIMADGKYSQDEFVWFKTVQHRHPLFADVPPDAFNPMLKRVKSRLSRESWRALVQEWAVDVPERYRLSIFDLATELAVVDKELEGKEPEVIKHLWHAMGIPDDIARKVFMDKIEKM
jgi:uncharacterized tellurite resistance protein B-like protein